MGFRAPPVNWKQQIKNLLDSYDVVYDLSGVNRETAIGHAVQKDAIQNSMDAYNPNNPDEWSVTFELHPTPPLFVAITDTGTYGLTGEVNLDEEILSKLDYERYVNERWSRFEALGYANPDPRARGARGQGKFIFIGSSEKQEMIYETLRADDIYRVGHWITRGAKPLMEPLEGDDAKMYLKKHVPPLEPLKHIGTRIIIMKATKELARAFLPLLECDLIRYISETWWERLLEGWKIYVRRMPHPAKIRVPPPRLYEEFLKHPEKFKHSIIRNVGVGFGKFKGAKVKELVIAYSDDEVPKAFQGIAVQRGGMKVMAFDIRQGNEHIEERYKRHFFGWIKFNIKAEKELREYENPTHYGFKKIRGSLAQSVLGTRGWLTKQVRKFAEDKLGIVPERKKRIALERVQLEVIDYLNRLARSLGYMERARIGLGREVGGTRGPTSPIRIQMPPFVLPGPTRRVNLDEEVKEIKARVVNDSKNETLVRFGISLKRPARAKRMTGEPMRVIELIEQMRVPAGKKSKWYGPYSILFSKDKYDAGKYTLKAQIVALEGKRKGEVFHKITRAIYVAVDPRAVGKFRKFEPAEFPEAIKRLRYRVEEEEEGLVIYYNIEHPAYKRADRMREIVQQGKERVINPVYDYLLDIGLAVLVTDDLSGEAKLLGDAGKHFRRLIEKDYEGIHEKVLSNRETLHQQLLFDAYS